MNPTNLDYLAAGSGVGVAAASAGWVGAGAGSGGAIAVAAGAPIKAGVAVEDVGGSGAALTSPP